MFLEDYLDHFPELGAAPKLSIQLIGEEYRARQRWGDRPTHQDYGARFPTRERSLLLLLRRIDTELAAEYRSREQTVPGRGPSTETVTVPALESIRSVTDLVNAIGCYRLLTPVQFDELTLDLRRNLLEVEKLAQELVARGWLTPYQIGHLLRGRAADLCLGCYVLLEQIGNGATGWVFKARHQRLGRVVALKVLRRELLADEELLARFYREIELVSSLAHPHVVHAYDAGPLGRAHALAMEYVEGIDLHRLVKQSGPLSALQALDCVLQAARGLQHIHEHGLVHRDIKPSNLLVSGGVVSGERSDTAGSLFTTQHSPVTTHQLKILDLGLAGLGKTTRAGTFEETLSGRLTPQESILMGTPDYMAPEQALDFHSADIRADIYSLGCTWYFLLTGKPPFSGGTVMQKLLRHQCAEPPALAELRPDVPPDHVQVLRRMLQKDPAERYQTPAELIAALAGKGPSTAAIPCVLRRKRPNRRRALAALVVGFSVLIASLTCLIVLAEAGHQPTQTRPQSQRHPQPPLEHVEAGDTLDDSGFEKPNVGAGIFDAFRYAPSDSAWQFVGGAGISGNGSGFTVGNPPAPQGKQVAFLQGAGSRFSQVVPFRGGTYTIRFLAARRANFNQSSQTYVVLVDDKSVGTFTPSSTTYAEYSTDRFTVSTGPHTLTFEGLNPLGGDNTSFIDGISLHRLTRSWRP
jgi:serine/threonine-protein kinase